ncbi:MAG: metal ABC transporter permease [Arsenophonus sp.]|nr:MAG: metal ABC transporter permease [Arsenophonus sp.]
MVILKSILHPLFLPFMQKAMIVSLLIGIISSILSCFLILKGWSLIGDAISHAVLPGIVIAYIFCIPLSIGAFLSGMFFTLSTGFLKEHTRIKEDTLIGIVFSGMFAFGLLLFLKINTEKHLTHILFGNILGMTRNEFFQVVYGTIIIFMLLIFQYKDLLVYCFDLNHAKIIGLKTSFLHYGLLSLISFTIVLALQAIGIILVISMLITPGVIAFTVCKRFNSMLLVSILSSITSSFFGIILSFHIDAATGSCIVLIQSIYFILILISNFFYKKKIRN